MEVRNASKLIGQFAMVGQLGLSLLMPLLMCLFACYLLVSKVSAPVWIYIPGFILGLGASMTTAYKVYLSVVQKEEKKKIKRNPNEVYFSKHI
ncbi:MAG: AtpZ/AtpI family protein [Butyrivibrio sp.]|nr:AtpZ/AtpI family protein [Butyrivibrio sp.]